MILFYFLIVFAFFLAIMQWVFRKIDAHQALSAKPSETPSCLLNSAQTRHEIIKNC